MDATTRHCQHCHRQAQLSARYCASCGELLDAPFVPPRIAAGSPRKWLLAAPLLITVACIAMLLWLLAGNSGSGSGAVGPGPIAAQLSVRSFPDYGIEIRIPSACRGVPSAELGPLYAELEDENVVLLAGYVNREETAGMFCLADRAEDPGLDTGALEVTGKLMLRDMADPSEPTVSLRAERVAGRMALVSDPLLTDGVAGRLVIVAGPARMFYFVCFGQTKQDSQVFYSQMRRALEQTRFL